MPLFFEIYYFFNIHSYNTITLRASLSIRRGPYSWILIASPLSKETEPRFELGPALQQADALPTELRRI